MKKFLSLVLALVMTMSLVTVSAGAKDFTDASKITYDEAVAVMSAAKVIDGYAEGDFRPTATLTRGAAAKIICNLILGPTTASALVADAAPYKDVPTTNTFAGYIAYCAKEGIISGYADGTFKPANTLTGYAFMKMLLGALGYDAATEGYTGPNWSIQVAKRALNIGLDDDLVSDFNGVKAVNREEACLYAFNTLKATMVEYDKNSTVTVGNITIKDTSSAKEMANTAKSETIKDDGKMQFAEKYFTDLKLNSNASDDFGRPANQWKVKSEEIGTYAVAADATYTKDVELGDIYSDLGLSKRSVPTIISNGVDQNNSSLVLFKGNSTKIGTGNGVLTEAYYDDDAETVTLVEIDTYVGQVDRSVAATKSKDAYIVISTQTAKPTGVSAGTLNYETDEKFEDDAYVLYTYAAGEVQSVVVAEKVSGDLSTYTVGKNLTVAGTKYDYSKNKVVPASYSTKSDYDVYLDAYGYAIYVDEQEFISSDYAFVLNAVGETALVNNNRAELLFTDGTTKKVDTKKDYSSTGTDLIGNFVTYKVKDGEYELKAVTSTMPVAANANFDLDRGTAKIKLNNSDVVYANSKTIFLVKTLDNHNDATYKAYTGIANVPSVTADGTNTVSAQYYKKGTDSMVTLMYINAGHADVSTSSKDVTFLAGKSVSGKITDSDDNTFYTYNAVVNGTITTVKVDANTNVASVMNQGTLVSGVTNALFSNANINDGIIEGLTAYTTDTSKDVYSASATGTVKLSGENTIGFGTTTKTYFSVASDCKVFFIDNDGEITTGSVSSIGTDTNDIAHYVVDDGELTYIFVQNVDDTATDPGASTNANYTAVLTKINGKITLTVTSVNGSAAEAVTGTVTTTGSVNLTSNLVGGNTALSSGKWVYTEDIATSSLNSVTYTATVKIGGQTIVSNTIIGG